MKKDKLIGELFDPGKGFWTAPRLLGGRELDKLRGQNIVSNAKTIDRTEGLSCIVSHKSTDLRKPSYRDAKRVYWLGMRFVRELLRYAGETRRDRKRKVTYHLHWLVEAPDCRRSLEWFVPLAGVPETHEKMLKQVIEDAEASGVEVRIYRIPD